MPDPAAKLEYEDRLRRREDEIARLERRDRWLGNARLAAIAVALALVWPALVTQVWSVAWLLPPLGIFAVLVAVHGSVVAALGRRRLAAGFYRRGLARLAGDRAEPLDDGAGFAPGRDHPYAEDLDLFGPGSLYALLCTAHSRPGRAALAEWLSKPADATEVARRQEAVVELRRRLDLREELAVGAAELSPELGAARLAGWGGAPRLLSGALVPAAAVVLGAVNAIVVVAALFGPLPGRVALVPLALAGLVALALRRRVTRVLAGLGMPAGELRFLAGLLGGFESQEFESALLRDLQDRSREGASRRSGGGGKRPSDRLLELARLIEWNDSRGNLFFQPLAALLLVGTQLAFAAERWRARHGEAVGGWLAAVGEFEALSSLASFAYENPGYTFPEVLSRPESASAPPLFVVEAITHPLLPREGRVANDVALGGEAEAPRLLLLSGSNMSGKSTLLRSVGVAAVLAQAGAPVAAGRLRMSSLAVGASIQLRDSLLEGTSRFYAELERLRRVRDLANAGPTLFLLDEMLHGTNSHDRRLGAEGVIRGLLDAGAIGLVTTHDLALAEIAAELAPLAVNVHFEDHLEAGRMAFDYRLRPGPVERGNALALMRALGLPVAEE